MDERSAADLYAVLGVAPHAPWKDIVHAYRGQVRTSHPDTRPDDPEAVERFRALTDAYDVLSDPIRRADYDRKRLGGGMPTRLRVSDVSTHVSPMYSEGRAFVPDPRVPAAPIWAGPVRVQGQPSPGGAAEWRIGGVSNLAALFFSFPRGLFPRWPG